MSSAVEAIRRAGEPESPPVVLVSLSPEGGGSESREMNEDGRNARRRAEDVNPSPRLPPEADVLGADCRQREIVDRTHLPL